MAERIRAYTGEDRAAAEGLLRGTVKSLRLVDRCRSHVLNLMAINSMPPAVRSDDVADYVRRSFPPPVQ